MSETDPADPNQIASPTITSYASRGNSNGAAALAHSIRACWRAFSFR